MNQIVHGSNFCSKRVLKEIKARQIFRKMNISYTLPPPWCSFLENLSFCFLVTSVLRFALLLHYRRIVSIATIVSIGIYSYALNFEDGQIVTLFFSHTRFEQLSWSDYRPHPKIKYHRNFVKNVRVRIRRSKYVNFRGFALNNF